MYRESSTEKGLSWFEVKPGTELSVPTPSLHVLLSEAFDLLRGELNANGNTQEYLRLRQSYGDKIRGWWGSKRSAYLESLTNSGQKLGVEMEIANGDRVCITRFEEYLTDDPTYYISHRASQETNELMLRGGERGIDPFMYPPRVVCRYMEDPNEPPNYEWEVVFRGPGITTFSRLRVHPDPNFELPYIKQTEILDCAIFGVDRLGMLEQFETPI